MIDVSRLKEELEACSGQIVDVDSAGAVSEWSGTPDQALAGLVLSAHQALPGSAEWIGLRTYLGVESAGWLAYVECRKQPAREARNNQYLRECMRLMLELFNGATGTVDGDDLINVRWPRAEAIALKQKIQEIIDANPE